MSFILDALKKSENERQQQADTEFASVPSGLDAQKAPRWLWILAVLLALNIAVLLGVVMRPDTPAPPAVVSVAPPTVEAPGAAESASGSDSFSDRIAEARRNQPEQSGASGAEPAVREAEPAAQVQSPAVSVDSLPQSERALLPTLTEVRVNGTVVLPDLHVDVHVYSEVPSERFVYINMNKYREQQTLEEGPVINEITNDGVILNYRGTVFILPRR